MSTSNSPASPLKKKLIVSGGGTGGHIYAGIAIIQEFKSRFPAGEVLFVGARGGIEERLVPRENIQLQTLALGSLKNVSLLRKLVSLFKVPLALLASARILLSFKPDAVIGVGGYASGPVVLMAKLLSPFLHAHTAVLEQNAVSGFTNRILGKCVDTVFTAFPGIENQFPGKNVVMSGNPIRGTFSRAPVKGASSSLCVFIFGGSQGALGMNTLVINSLDFLKDLPIKWIHQTGEVDYQRVKSKYESLGLDASVEKFIYTMKEAYGEADLVIARAGASTLAEIAAVERPIFLVPLPTAADNHQEVNGRLFEVKGAARVFLQNKTSPEEFAKEVRALLLDRTAQEKFRLNLRAFHRPDCTKVIVNSLVVG